MIAEIKVKFYSEKLKVGFNDYRAVFSEVDNTWYNTYYHLGRIVYGKNRLSFNKVRKSLTHTNFTVREFMPF